MRFAHLTAAAALVLVTASPAPAQQDDANGGTEVRTVKTRTIDNPATLDDRPVDSRDARDDDTQDRAAKDRDAKNGGDSTFDPNEITQAASDFFGVTTEAAAKAVQRVFKDQGMPDAYIKGDEGAGAVVVGLRYGEGWLVRKHFEPVKVYWKGPSIGFDLGGNASKFFALVYNLRRENRLYQRFPSAEGSYYFIAGIGVNYLRSGGVTVAPMRTGLGLRAGVSAGYLVFSEERDWFPF